MAVAVDFARLPELLEKAEGDWGNDRLYRKG
jgi:hypothetical protein